MQGFRAGNQSFEDLVGIHVRVGLAVMQSSGIRLLFVCERDRVLKQVLWTSCPDPMTIQRLNWYNAGEMLFRILHKRVGYLFVPSTCVSSLSEIP